MSTQEDIKSGVVKGATAEAGKALWLPIAVIGLIVAGFVVWKFFGSNIDSVYNFKTTVADTVKTVDTHSVKWKALEASKKDEIQKATERTVLVNTMDRKLNTLSTEFKELKAKENSVETRVLTLETDSRETKGDVERAVKSLEQLDNANTAQRERALVRQADRKVKYKQVDTNTDHINVLQEYNNRAVRKELEEYRKRTIELENSKP